MLTLHWMWLAGLAVICIVAGFGVGRRRKPHPDQGNLDAMADESAAAAQCVPFDTEEFKVNIPAEHFWFTATMLAINGFVISAEDWRLLWPATLWLGALNLYAIYLVLHRATSYAGKLVQPAYLAKRAQKERSYRDKLAETLLNLRTVVKHIPFIFAECSGAMFYILLIVSSYILLLSKYYFSVSSPQ